MSMHPDLKWLAENVSEWKLGATAVQKFGGIVDWLTKSLSDLGGVGELCFTPDQWQAARQQLEGERNSEDSAVSDEQWSEWIEWDGGECPHNGDVIWADSDGDEHGPIAGIHLDWSNSGMNESITAYRYRLDSADERINNIASPEEDEQWQAMEERQKRSKYHVQIRPGVWVDVYDVLHAFGVTNPGDQHAIKKMLKPGQRGHKDATQDRREAIQSLERAIELEESNGL